MQLVFAAGALIVLAVAAMRFGVDTRERSHNGWFAGLRNTPEDIGTASINFGSCPSLRDMSTYGPIDRFVSTPVDERADPPVVASEKSAEPLYCSAKFF
jgi:hypothetical protein